MTEDISPGSSQAPPDGTDERTHRFDFEQTDHQPIGVSIIRAVSSVSEIDPLSLQPRLYDVIDADAIETLLSTNSTQSDVRITFRFASYEITVRQSGSITVRDDTRPN